MQKQYVEVRMGDRLYTLMVGDVFTIRHPGEIRGADPRSRAIKTDVVLAEFSLEKVITVEE